MGQRFSPDLKFFLGEIFIDIKVPIKSHLQSFQPSSQAGLQIPRLSVKAVLWGSERGRELTWERGQGSFRCSSEGLPGLPLCLGKHPNILVSKLLFDQQNKVPV